MTVAIDDPRLPPHFWTKVSPEPNSGCWLWAGTAMKNGYGQFRTGPRMSLAHRVAFRSLVGEVREGLDLDHLCRTRCCVNPAHLEPVSRKENLARGLSGRRRQSVLLDRAHCKEGHPMPPRAVRENGTLAPWVCRLCSRAAQNAYNAAHRKEARAYYAANCASLLAKQKLKRAGGAS